jgi:cysteine desulfurase/selenocysteine lyase
MTTPDLTGSPVSPAEAQPVAAGAFVPDAAAIERLANAFFQSLNGGAPPALPAVPASPPAPWTAPAPTSPSVAAAAVPIQPPMGAVEPPLSGLPSSVPARSFGGASASSGSPFAVVQSRAVAPAASQTAIAAPRVDPLQSVARLSPVPVQTSPEADALAPGAAPPSASALSPFSAPLDLSAAIGALVAATGFSAAPAYEAPGFAAPGYGVSGAPTPGLGDVSRVSAVAPPPSALAAFSPSTPSPVSPEPYAPSARPSASPDAGSIEAPRYSASSADVTPFGTSANLDAVPRGLTGLPQTSAPPNADLLRSADASTAPPTAATAGAPSVAIAPVFTEASSGVRTYDAATIRNDFPILQEKVHGKRLIWLDNGATTQKPQAVIDRLAAFYAHENSNVHRGAHTLAARATDAYEAARDKVRKFVNASSMKEIVFVRGATEGINLVAQAWGRRNVKAGDEIVITWLEHHANIVPWQQLCLETGAKLRVAPVDDRGDIQLDEYEKLLGPRTRMVALTMVSNALGTVTPAREMVAAAHRHGALALVDGAQSVSHRRTDVQALDADFFVLSGHKMFAPTGIGAVYGKQGILETMPPWQGGGNMIADVTFERTVYQGPPDRFEAGTGNIADAVGLGAAIDYLDTIGMEPIAAHEHELIEQTVAGLRGIRGVYLIGAPRERAGVVSFLVDGCRTEDIGKALDREGIAVRAGHHCAQPILRRFGLESTVRPSFALYNTAEDVEALLAAVRRIALQAQGGSR